MLAMLVVSTFHCIPVLSIMQQPVQKVLTSCCTMQLCSYSLNQPLNSHKVPNGAAQLLTLPCICGEMPLTFQHDTHC